MCVRACCVRIAGGNITDADTARLEKLCSDWMAKYDLVVGTSWGAMAKQEQLLWNYLECNSHVDDAPAHFGASDYSDYSTTSDTAASDTAASDTAASDTADLF